MRLSRPTLTANGPHVGFTFDGRPVRALPGETVAAALAADNVAAIRRSDSDLSQTWRGQYCGMGACFECVVTIDGRAGQRACMTRLRGGEVVCSAAPSGTPDDRLAALADAPADSSLGEEEMDILVVGAGPAGLSAALAARQSGASVVVLDERAQPGGQYYKPVATSHTVSSPADPQFASGEALVEAARSAGVRIVQDAVVWGALAPDEVLALIAGTARVFRPRRLILATGAFERANPVPGWTLPGVMTAGAAQTLARAYQVAPGKRIVVAGNGPLNFQLAADLVARGVQVAAVIESAPRPSAAQTGALLRALTTDCRSMLSGLQYLIALYRAGVRIFWSHTVSEVLGTERVEYVRIAELGSGGVPDTSETRPIDADTLCLGYGLIASSEIARALGCRLRFDPRHVGTLAVETSEIGETSVAGVFATGDGAVVAGAPVAEASGKIAGFSAAAQLGFTQGSPEGSLGTPSRARRKLAQARAFQDALWRLFEAPPISFDQVTDDTTLCRCESLSFGRVRAEITGGVCSLGVLKRRTRLGMGRCQGRYCTPVAAHLLSSITGLDRGIEEAFAPRLPAKPFPAVALGVEKPEWGGHQRAGSPDLSRPVPREPFGETEAEIVVIGGGVVGACLAYELVKAGHDTVIVERDDANMQASGANAGSLHVQLLSFDFGDKAEAGGGPAAATLPLGPWSVSLWREYAEACGGDFEIRITGGLMVAETEAGMAFLREKAALERRHGLEAEIIGGKDLRDLAPALSENLIGAEYSPREGKINPLIATYSVLDLARRRGARFFPGTDVTGLERSGARWVVSTNRGTLRCGRVVNAAGPWARSVGAMIGQDVPVFSAPLQMIVTERAPSLISQLVAHADRHLSMKQLASGGLVIGGAWTARYDERQNLNLTVRESIEGNLWVANRVLPQLAGLHVLRTWAGMNVNIDGAPIIGEVPGAPGFYNAVTSNGYTLAPAIARLTADIITSGKTDIDVRPYLIDRF